MADSPIETGYTTGQTVYVVRHNPDGTVWNTDSQAWEAYNSSHWTDYAIELAEQTGSGYYRAAQTIPNLDVLTTDVLYNQAGGAPALGDTLIGIGQSQGTNLFALNSSVASAANLQKSAGSMLPGTVQSGSNTTAQIVSNLTGATNNLYNGRVIIFLTGNAAGSAAIATGYNHTNHILTFTTVAIAPTAGDTFIIV